MSILLTNIKMSKSAFAIVCIPYYVCLTWYIIFSTFFPSFIVDSETFSTCSAIFNFIIVFALLFGLFIIRKINKIYAIYTWSAFSLIGTILIFFASNGTLKLTMYYLLGGLFGISQLAFFTLFWDLTVLEERGRMSGLMGFISLSIFVFSTAIAGSLDFLGLLMLVVFLNLVIFSIKILNPKKILILTAKKTQKVYDPDKRMIILYLVPWIVFSLINATLAVNISFGVSQLVSPDIFILFSFLQGVGAGFGALIGGIIADFFGRRVSLAFGLTLYGFSSALVGLGKYEMFYLVYVANGLNWGILSSLYLLTIWGDLSTTESCANRYSLGLIIFYLSAGIGRILVPQIYQIPMTTASILVCSFIFLSNIPLILAPELLPTDFREKIRLKSYIYLLKKKLRRLPNQG